MSVARRRWPGRSCDLYPTLATKLTSMLGYDHYLYAGLRSYCFYLLLRRYPHQSSTRPHTSLHTRPTHSPSKEFRLHSLNHLQEFRLKLLIPFQELRFNSRLRAFGPRALRPFAPYPIPGSCHSLNHLQEFRLKLLIPFQELRLDLRLRAFGPRALRPSRLTASQVRILTNPGSVVFYYISFKIQHDPACVLTMCGVQFTGDFLLRFDQ